MQTLWKILHIYLLLPICFYSLGKIPSNFSEVVIWHSPSQVAQAVKNSPTMLETQVRSLGWEDPLGKEMATHCNILAWRIPWKEEPGGLQSMGSQTDTTEQLYLRGGFSLFYPDIFDYHSGFNTVIKTLSSRNHSVSILFWCFSEVFALFMSSTN